MMSRPRADLASQVFEPVTFTATAGVDVVESHPGVIPTESPSLFRCSRQVWLSSE